MLSSLRASAIRPAVVGRPAGRSHRSGRMVVVVKAGEFGVGECACRVQTRVERKCVCRLGQTSELARTRARERCPPAPPVASTAHALRFCGIVAPSQKKKKKNWCSRSRRSTHTHTEPPVAEDAAGPSPASSPSPSAAGPGPSTATPDLEKEVGEMMC